MMERGSLNINMSVQSIEAITLITTNNLTQLGLKIKQEPHMVALTRIRLKKCLIQLHGTSLRMRYKAQ